MPRLSAALALAGALALSVVASAQTPQAPLALVPQPRSVTDAGTVPLRRGVAVVMPGDSSDRFAARDLIDELRARGVPVRAGAEGADVVVSLRRRTAPAASGDSSATGEGYTIQAARATGAGAARVTVVASTPEGVFYGAQTVKQLVDGAGRNARFHLASVRDWPAMRWRGLHDDLSRGPVPTLDYQKRQIRTFAAYKINVYSPYYEHTLMYPSNPLGAPPGGAMTPAEVKELVAYARRYHVEVVPEQEAFGHLHHLLKYELYSPLAETPHGHVLAPGQPGSMALIRQMFANIDTLFPGRFIHLGADETFELGRGQTQQRVQSEGIGAVYLGFLKEIEAALATSRDSMSSRAQRGTCSSGGQVKSRSLAPLGMTTSCPEPRKFLFWGDIAQNHPDLVKTLPKDLVAVAWEYDPAEHFDRLITPFTQAGLETWVAPGVNNWNRVYPNNDFALRNIQGFVRDGQRLGADGVLNTTWDDDGESLFEQTWYGVLFGAAASWQPGESSIPAFQAAFGRVFHGDTTGMVNEAQRKMIAAHALLDSANLGDASDYLFWVDPYTSEGRRTAERIRPVLHELRVLAESALVLVDQARPGVTRETGALDALALGARKIDFIGMKFQFADEIATAYARAVTADTTREARSSASRDLGDITGINGRAQDLRDGYSLIRDEYEKAWLRENRPYWLHNVLARYDQATQRWIDRIDRVTQARREWNRTRRLTPADSIGIPPMPGLTAPPTTPPATPARAVP